MGGEKTTQTTDQRSKPTAEETELNKLLLNRQRTLDPKITDVQGQQLDLASLMLAGAALPGMLGGIQGGIGELSKLGEVSKIDPTQYTIGEDVTSQIVQKSLEDIAPRYQTSGILDSGVAAELSGELAKDIRLGTAQSNLDTSLAIEQQNIANQLGASQFDIQNEYSQQAFDINTLLSLLNLTLGGSTELQSPVMAQGQQLSNALAGLRQNVGTVTTIGMNPFVKSFQTSAGSGMGNFFNPSTYIKPS